MNVLVTGATGFIGRKVCAALSEGGHGVRVLSRNPAAARARLPGAKVLAWRPLEGPPPVEALESVHAVVHLAGEPVAGSWRRPGKKAAIQESRVRGTENLVAGIAAAGGVERFLCASAVGYYGEGGERELAEDAPPGEGFLPGVCRAWEAAAEQAAGACGTVFRLRIGLVLGPDGGALPPMVRAFRFGLGGPFGSGRQWWPWIHREDLVGLIRFLLEEDLPPGPVNATAPGPVRQRAFARTLARILHRPAVLPAPAVALRLLLGGFAEELLASRKVIPRRALEAGFRFTHPGLEEALEALLLEA